MMVDSVRTDIQQPPVWFQVIGFRFYVLSCVPRGAGPLNLELKTQNLQPGTLCELSGSATNCRTVESQLRVERIGL